LFIFDAISTKVDWEEKKNQREIAPPPPPLNWTLRRMLYVK
jgi:hypothetical protein